MTDTSLAVLHEAAKETVQWEIEFPNGRIMRTGAVGPETTVPDRIPPGTVKSIVFTTKNNIDQYEPDEIKVRHPDGTEQIVPLETPTESICCDACGSMLLGATQHEAIMFTFDHDCEATRPSFSVDTVSDPLADIGAKA